MDIWVQAPGCKIKWVFWISRALLNDEVTRAEASAAVVELKCLPEAAAGLISCNEEGSRVLRRGRILMIFLVLLVRLKKDPRLRETASS